MKKLVIIILLTFLSFTVGCSTQVEEKEGEKEPPKVEEPKVETGDIFPEVKNGELSAGEKEKWLKYFMEVGVVDLPQFGEGEEINDKILISAALKYILKNPDFYSVEKDKYEKLQDYPEPIPKIKPSQVEQVVEKLFAREIKEHQGVGGTLDFRGGYYWILPHGVEESFAYPKIVSYINNGDNLEFILEYYYNDPSEEGYTLDDGSTISDEEFIRRLFDGQDSLKKEGQPYKVLQLKVRNNGGWYSLVENINVTPREGWEIFPGKSQGFLTLERRSYLYRTSDWNEYNCEYDIITLSVDFPAQWGVTHTVFIDGEGVKKGELLPPVRLHEGQGLLDNWTPYQGLEFISRKEISINNHNGQQIITKAFFDGQENYWYPYYYYVQINDIVLGIVFLETTPQADSHLHYQILKTLTIK